MAASIFLRLRTFKPWMTLTCSFQLFQTPPRYALGWAHAALWWKLISAVWMQDTNYPKHLTVLGALILNWLNRNIACKARFLLHNNTCITANFMSVLCSIHTVPQSCTKPFTPSTQRGKPNCLLAQRRDALLCHQTTFSTLHIELNHENHKQDWAQPWWSQAPNKKALDVLLRTETYRSQWTVTMSHSWWGLDRNSCEDIFIKHWWNFISFSSLWYSGTKGFFKRDLRRVTVCWIWCNLIHLHLFIFYLGRWSLSYKRLRIHALNHKTALSVFSFQAR